MAERSEGVMTLVDPRYTSQTCSGFGSLVSKTLAERVHVCPCCGLVLDRDVNASRVILRKGIPLEQRESKSVDEATTTPLLTEMQVAPVKQEATQLVG